MYIRYRNISVHHTPEYIRDNENVFVYAVLKHNWESQINKLAIFAATNLFAM